MASRFFGQHLEHLGWVCDFLHVIGRRMLRKVLSTAVANPVTHISRVNRMISWASIFCFPGSEIDSVCENE